MLDWRDDCEDKLLSSLAPASAEYEGFCPILPRRESFTHSLAAVLAGTVDRYWKQGRNEIRAKLDLPCLPKDEAGLTTEEKRSLYLEVLCNECGKEEKGQRRADPNRPGSKLPELLLIQRSRKYEKNVEAIRDYFIAQTGLIQPMVGPIEVEIELVYPNEGDKQTKQHVWWRGWDPRWDLDNALKPILDAMDPRMWTKDHKRAGLLPNDELVVRIVVSKHEHAADEEGPGFRWRIKSLAEDTDDGETPVDE